MECWFDLYGALPSPSAMNERYLAEEVWTEEHRQDDQG